MISEPKFIFSIKQTSLHGKEDSYMDSIDSQCPYLTLDLDSTQPPWLIAVSRYLSPSNPCLSLSDLCKSRLRLLKLTTQKCSVASRDENLGSWSPLKSSRAATHWKNSNTYSTCCHRFFTSRSAFRHMRRHVGLVVCRSMESKNLAFIWHHMRLHVLPKFLSHHHMPVHSLMLQPHAKNPC